MIDRAEPSNRPTGKNDGTQRWESLLFSHWEIDPDESRPLVPVGLDLDTYEDRAYVGIVPFKMRDIRPSWLPRRFAFSFLETNVRTYVTCNGRPGVYFFLLDANSLLAVLAARIGWSLPYHHAKMTASEVGQTIFYSSHRRGGRASHQVSFRVREKIGSPPKKSIEYFLVERYLLFTEKRGAIHCGQVHHSAYEIWNAEIGEMSEDQIAASGLSPPPRPPVWCIIRPVSMSRSLQSERSTGKHRKRFVLSQPRERGHLKTWVALIARGKVRFIAAIFAESSCIVLISVGR